MNCGNGIFGGGCWWIIILLIILCCCGGCGNNMGRGNCGCDCDNNCC